MIFADANELMIERIGPLVLQDCIHKTEIIVKKNFYVSPIYFLKYNGVIFYPSAHNNNTIFMITFLN